MRGKVAIAQDPGRHQCHAVGLWVAFLFGAALGALLGHALGRRAGARMRPFNAPPILQPRGTAAPGTPGSTAGANDVLNALNNRLAAISALADLLPADRLAPSHARALEALHLELRRAADLTAHFRELAERPGAPGQAAAFAPVLATVLAERGATLRTLDVTVTQRVPDELASVECPGSVLHEIVAKLVDFSLHRLAAAKPPRELRVDVSEAGPSLVVALSDSGAPLSVTAEERLLTPFRFTQGGGGEIEFALARAMVQSVGGTLRLRPRAPGAEIVMTLTRSAVERGDHAPPAQGPTLPALKILVVDDDVSHRDALTQLLRRDGHDVAAVPDGIAALARLRGNSPSFDVVLADMQMPQLGGRGLFEQVAEANPRVARRFVFMTGDRARPDTKAFLETCGQPSVLKPFDLGELLAAIRMAAGET
jgi:CheY-like chemotaxis protein